MGNWLSAEPGMSSADIDHNPSGQRDDNRRGGEEAVEKGRNQTAVEGYSGAQRKAKEKRKSARAHVLVAPVTVTLKIGAQTLDTPVLISPDMSGLIFGID